MWMESLRERRALSFFKRSHFDRSQPSGSHHLDTRLRHTRHRKTIHQHTNGQDITFTLDTNFCSCCYEYRSRNTTAISRSLFISNTVPVTLLIISSLFINSCYANAQSPPVSTAVTQRPHPGISTFPILRHDEEKSQIVESQSQGRTIPGAPYYEFFINEASYKFWVVFQLTTVFILLYSAFAAIYFAKYTFLTEIETLKEEDILLRRRRQLNSKTVQGIIKATTSLPFRFKDTSSSSRVRRRMNVVDYSL